MGQRHQIYIKLAHKEDEEFQSKIIAYHDQWLYGAKATSRLKNCISFVKEHRKLYKGMEYANLIDGKASVKDATRIFQNIYTVDYTTGGTSGTFPLSEYEKDKINAYQYDPRYGDNNNGITILDLSDPKKIKYCFLSLHGLECLVNDEAHNRYTDFEPISVELWHQLHYGEDLSEITKTEARKLRSTEKKINKDAQLMTLQEVKKLFPLMYEEQLHMSDLVAKIKEERERKKREEEFLGAC